jgi:hypothetical protein
MGFFGEDIAKLAAQAARDAPKGDSGGSAFGGGNSFLSGAGTAVPQTAKKKKPSPEEMKAIMRSMGNLKFNKGGVVSTGRGDGIAVRGKTKCKMY